MKTSITSVLFCVVALHSCKKTEEIKTTKTHHSISMDNGLMQAMSSSSKIMNSVKINGDFDYDFAKLMIMHHQMAIDMSVVQINKGSNQTIKDMAKEIVSDQEDEISEMRIFLKNYKIPANKNQASNSYKLDEEMKLMMQNMNAVKMTNNIDTDYVAIMIPHHESAVIMANQQLKYGKNEILLKLSKNIITNQNKEILAFKNWQTNN